MKVDHLRVFAAVFRANSFAPVARERSVAPSSISRAIATLEDDLNVRLFHRTTRQLTPTSAGVAFFHRVAPLIEELDAARSELIDDAQTPSGALRISASVSYGQIVLAPRLPAFRERYPNIELELLLTDHRVDLVGERVDLAFRHGSLPDSSMIARKVRDVSYFVVASPAYLASADAIAEPGDIAEHPVVTFSYDGFRSRWRFRKRQQRRSVDVRPALAVSNAMVIRQCARDGMGLALLADWTVDDDLNNGSLVRVLPAWEAAGAGFDSSIWCVYPSRSYTPERVRVFSEMMSARS